MECTFKDPSTIKKIVNALEHSVDNLNLIASKEGLRVAATNSSQTDMRQLVLTPDFFDVYRCIEEESKFGLNMGLLKKFMSTAGPTDTIKWCGDLNKAIFNIEIISTGDNSIEKHWTLRLIDINEDELCPPPNTQFDVSMRISSVMVSDWINNCKLINGDFAIGVEKDKCIMVRCNSDEGTLNLKQSLPSVMANVFHTSEDFTSIMMTIGIKLADSLNTMIKCSPGVDIEMSPYAPLCSTCYLNPEKTSFIRLWIAPKHEEDDDD